jgi:hypothetical protein
LVADYAVALRASLVAYGVGGAFIGVAYWDLLYHLIATAILLEALAQRREAKALPTEFGGDLSFRAGRGAAVAAEDCGWSWRARFGPGCGD